MTFCMKSTKNYIGMNMRRNDSWRIFVTQYILLQCTIKCTLGGFLFACKTMKYDAESVAMHFVRSHVPQTKTNHVASEIHLTT